MTKTKVEEYCRLKIADSVWGKLCRRLLHITFDKEIKGCVEDVKVRLEVSYTHTTDAHTHMHAFIYASTYARTYKYFEMSPCMLSRYFTN